MLGLGLGINSGQQVVASGGGGSSSAQWDNSAKSADITVSGTNSNIATETAGTIGAVYATKALPVASLCYWEVVLGSGSVMPGLANTTAKTTPGYTTWWYSANPSNAAVLFGSNASVNLNGTAHPTNSGGITAGATDVIGFYVDTTNHLLYLDKNNAALYGDVSAGTGGLDISSLGTTLYAILQAQSSNGTAHFAAADFTYTPKAGYAAF